VSTDLGNLPIKQRKKQRYQASYRGFGLWTEEQWKGLFCKKSKPGETREKGTREGSTRTITDQQGGAQRGSDEVTRKRVRAAGTRGG